MVYQNHEWSVKKCLLFKVLIAHAGTVQNKKPVQFCTCFIFCTIMEYSGLVGRVLDWVPRVASLSLTAVVSLSMRLYPLLSTGSTQEDLALHDCKIVDWDIKN